MVRYHVTHQTAHIPVHRYMEEYRDVAKFIACCRRCSMYGATWSCPPFDFDTDQYLAPYTDAYLIGSKIIISPRSIVEYEGEKVVFELMKEIIADVRRHLDPRLLALEQRYPGRAFYAGTCHICPLDSCTRPHGLPCIHPELIRPSLETFGFDLGRSTSDLLGIEMKWSRDGRLPEYLTLVSGFFAHRFLPDFRFDGTTPPQTK